MKTLIITALLAMLALPAQAENVIVPPVNSDFAFVTQAVGPDGGIYFANIEACSVWQYDRMDCIQPSLLGDQNYRKLSRAYWYMRDKSYTALPSGPSEYAAPSSYMEMGGTMVCWQTYRDENGQGLMQCEFISTWPDGVRQDYIQARKALRAYFGR